MDNLDLNNYCIKSLETIVNGRVCIKSYIKQVQQTQQQIQKKPGVLNKVSNAASNVKQDLNPKRNLLVFLKDFFPGLLLGFITNFTRASGNALIAIQLTLQDQANGVIYSPADFKALYTQVEGTLRVLGPYLAAEDQGLANEAQKVDDVIEKYVELISRKDLDVNVFQRAAYALSQKVQRAQRFIDLLQARATQIARNIVGKTEEHIIEQAQNETQPATGFWGRIVNWVKNKVGRGKAYGLYGVSGIREGELNLFITNLGLAYHLAATSSSLMEKIVKTSIMNRNCAEPRALAPDTFESFIDEIQDTFEFLTPDNIPTLDYISIKTKIDSLLTCAKVYVSALNDATLDAKFKIVQLRSICLLIINTLRDLIPICLKMDPLVAVMDF